MSLPELTGAGRTGLAALSPAPSLPLAQPGTGARLTPPATQVARRTATGPAYDPRVIDGEVTGSWFVRPIVPILAGSGALFALGVAALVQEALR